MRRIVSGAAGLALVIVSACGPKGHGGGTGGAAGSSSSSGGPHCPGSTACASAASCPAPPTTCVVATCTGGCCGVVPAAKGTACADTGDTACDGMGACVSMHCTHDSDCAAGEYCETSTNGGTCTPTKAGGKPCAAADECASGFCATGVCCDSACNENCRACTMALTGVADGTCADLLCDSPCTAGRCLVTLATVPSGGPRWIAVDATSVYWDTFGIGGALMKCGINGCGGTPTQLATGDNLQGIAVNATDVYWIHGVSGVTWVAKCPSTGCGGMPTLFTKSGGMTSDWGLAIDATNVYFARSGNPGAVMYCPLGGCAAPSTLASGQNNPTAIAVDATNVYWTNHGDGTVAQCAIGGCTAPTQIAAGQANMWGLGVDKTSVYWTTNGTPPGYTDGTVMRCAIGGCGGVPTPLAIATGPSRPQFKFRTSGALASQARA